MKVLIIEDDKSTALLTELELHQAGIETVKFTDHFESIPARVAWPEIDAAIVDQYLGFFDGRTLLQWLEREWPDIRRIMLTGDTRIDTQTAHADIVLFKPASAEVIRGALNGG